MRTNIILALASSALGVVLAHNNAQHHGDLHARAHVDKPAMIRRLKDKRQNILQDAFNDATS